MGESMDAVIRREREPRRTRGREDAAEDDGTGRASMGRDARGIRCIICGNGTRARGETNPVVDDCYHDE